MPQAIKKAAQPNEPDHGALQGKSWYYCVDGAKNPSCFINRSPCPNIRRRD